MSKFMEMNTQNIKINIKNAVDYEDIKIYPAGVVGGIPNYSMLSRLVVAINQCCYLLPHYIKYLQVHIEASGRS